MADTLTRSTDYYQRVAELSTVPFWHLGEFDEPVVPERSHVWHWQEVVSQLLASRDLVDDDAAALQRRALLLRNPGLVGPGFGATNTLVAAYQMLLPGESAPVHSHSFSALRFGAEGSDARMVVDGESLPLCPGDLLLTPGWRWHGHLHPAGDEPAVWFDGLDVPFVMALRAGFHRSAPPDLARSGPREATGASPTLCGLGPAGERSDGHSPVRRYPWDEAYPALRRLMARADDGHGATLEYRNPLTGGPALATIACALQGLAGGARTRPTRETASSVYFVARGRGTMTCGGQRHDFGANDVIAVPAWTWTQLEAGDDELVVFRMSDRPLHDAFGLYRAETG